MDIVAWIDGMEQALFPEVSFFSATTSSSSSSSTSVQLAEPNNRFCVTIKLPRVRQSRHVFRASIPVSKFTFIRRHTNSSQISNKLLVEKWLDCLPPSSEFSSLASSTASADISVMPGSDYGLRNFGLGEGEELFAERGPPTENIRPDWRAPGEMSSCDEEDSIHGGSTVGSRIRHWYRQQRVMPAWASCCSFVGSKITLRKFVLFVLTSLVLAMLKLASYTSHEWKPAHITRSACITKEFGYNESQVSVAAFLPPEMASYRVPDTIDTFQNYSYRNNTNCQISSLDLHAAFAPLCTTRASMLEAVSGGGRIGFEAPFMPRGCDMRWFTTEEVCEILSRFDKVLVVGDSMMRHVVGALNVLIRKDLGYGAVTNWNFNSEERRDCFCNRQFDVKDCSVQGIFRTSDVLANNPSSLACPVDAPVDLIIELMLRYPLDPVEVDRYKSLLAAEKPLKPYAFIFGHGLWNDLDLSATLNWLDGILDHTQRAAPYLSSRSRNRNRNKLTAEKRSPLWPRLIITPNAAGTLKHDAWVQSQGDKALQIFEHSVRDEALERGIDHLGTWNMSIQTNKFDGVHLDLKGNLVKAMAVVNWLAMIDVEEW